MFQEYFLKKKKRFTRAYTPIYILRELHWIRKRREKRRRGKEGCGVGRRNGGGGQERERWLKITKGTDWI